MSYKPRNPRYNQTFSVTIKFEDYIVTGRAFSPSAYGASVEIQSHAHSYLKQHEELWKDQRRIQVTTHLNDLPAAINSIFESDGKFILSLKLLDERSWYH